ncbi:S-layer homology domain-containing protein, partial [Paenibacillus sp. y28]|uniref:S-layer homology domain-containing protein n=1 Tax=Paenibacillus sp. y28 TaxID=3129110 RepID=UPI00301A3E07
YGDWNTPITREQMAKIAVRAIGQKAEDEKQWLYLATKAGLITGLGGGELGPDQPTTRAQSVTIIERILNIRAGGKEEVDKAAVNMAELHWHKTNIFTVMPQFFGNVMPGYEWDPNNLFVETPDGKYRGELDALIAVDMEDPNDPNLKELGDLSTLQWFNLADKTFPVTDYPKSYILFFKGHVDYNYDTTIYGAERTYLPYSIGGVTNVDMDSFRDGKLTKSAPLYRNKVADVPGYIIPKLLYTNNYLILSLRAPAIAPNKDYRKDILQVTAPLSIY